MKTGIHNITVLQHDSGDWVGLYINGKLELEGHNLYWDDILYILGLEADLETVSDEDMVANRMPSVLPEEL